MTVDLNALEAFYQARMDGQTMYAANPPVLALIAIARAAQAAGPFPVICSDDIGTSCTHCDADVVEYSGEPVVHRPDCPGVRLRDALAAIKEDGK